MRDLVDLLTNDASEVPLDRAALDIARLEYPELNPDPWLRILDDIAIEIANKTGDLGDNRRFIEVANAHLFKTLGLRGNTSEYHDIRNSCLNDVLDRRLGIPITLSVVYMEVARRLAKPLYGIGLPGHFIVRFDDGDLSVHIDPFSRGRFLSKDDCLKMVRAVTGYEPDETAFIPFTPRQTVVRMLQNMKGNYVRAEAYDKALRVFDLILSSGVYGVSEYKQRAVVNLQMRRYQAAESDLETYLTMAPEAADRPEVLAHLEAIRRSRSPLN